MALIIKLKQPVDYHHAANMMANGHLGGFAESLGLTWFRADSLNREKIQSTWPELFEKAFQVFLDKDRK